MHLGSSVTKFWSPSLQIALFWGSSPTSHAVPGRQGRIWLPAHQPCSCACLPHPPLYTVWHANLTSDSGPCPDMDTDVSHCQEFLKNAHALHTAQNTEPGKQLNLTFLNWVTAPVMRDNLVTANWPQIWFYPLNGMPGPGWCFCLAGTAVEPELEVGALARSCPVPQQLPCFTPKLAAGPADACWDFTVPTLILELPQISPFSPSPRPSCSAGSSQELWIS